MSRHGLQAAAQSIERIGSYDMVKNISWVEAKLSDSKIAKLISKLTTADKIVATGGCAVAVRRGGDAE